MFPEEIMQPKRLTDFVCLLFCSAMARARAQKGARGAASDGSDEMMEMGRGKTLLLNEAGKLCLVVCCSVVSDELRTVCALFSLDVAATCYLGYSARRDGEETSTISSNIKYKHLLPWDTFHLTPVLETRRIELCDCSLLLHMV